MHDSDGTAAPAHSCYLCQCAAGAPSCAPSHGRCLPCPCAAPAGHRPVLPAGVDLGLAELEHLRLEGGLDQVGEVGPGTVEEVAPGTVAEELVPGIVGVVVLEIAGEVGLGTVGEGAVPEIAVEVGVDLGTAEVAVPGIVEAGLGPGTAAAVDTVVG